MIVCFYCNHTVTGSQATLVRICHRVVYLCPKCSSLTANGTSGRVDRASLLERQVYRSTPVPAGNLVKP